MIATYSPRSIRSETPLERVHDDVLGHLVGARDVAQLDDRRRLMPPAGAEPPPPPPAAAEASAAAEAAAATAEAAAAAEPAAPPKPVRPVPCRSAAALPASARWWR